MVLIKSFLVGALAAVAAAKSAVLDLTPDNFDKVVLKSGKPTLVEFFAPWCGHCKNLAPVYEELASTFEFAKDKVQVAKVDADAHRSLGQRFGVQGFPTLKWFDGKSDKPTDYSSGRDLDSLSGFITEKTSVKPKKKLEKPSSVVMLNDGSFAKEIGGDKDVLVAFTAPWCGHCKNLAPVYEELAGVYASSKDVQIAKVDADAEKDLGRRFGVQGFPTLKWFDGKSDKPTDYNGGRDLDSLTKFISEKTGAKPKRKLELPSQVDYLNDKSFKETVGSDKNVFVAFTAPWCGHCKNLAPTWEKLAEDFTLESNVVIGKVDAEAENAKATAQDQGVTSYPTIKFFPAGSTDGELYSGGRTEADLVAFINEKVGTHRVVGGGLDAKAGTIDILNHIALKFAAGGETLSALAAEAKKSAEGLGKDVQYKYAEYYLRVFDKLSKSDNYVAKELARLDGIIKKGGLAPSKLDELTTKTNILKQFIADVTDKVTGGKDEL